MLFKKRLNNNVIVVEDEHGREKILIGCGLGFQVKVGTIVDESKVEKVYYLSDPNMSRKLQELINHTPIEYIDLANEIVDYAKIRIGNVINESVIISLCDHIYMSVERNKQGIEVKNFMLWDIRRFYRDEFEVGLYAVKLVQERFEIKLPEDEAGFIALHIVNSQLNLQKKSVKEVTSLIQEMERIVRMTFSINIDVDSVYYYRFITHLKFFTERLFSEKPNEEQDVDTLLALIIKKYPEAYNCVMKIAQYIQGKYGYVLSEAEILYLSIHISRIASTS